MAMHRLAQAEAMADAIGHYAVRPEIEDRIELALVRGDIAFYRGDIAGALDRYQASGADPADSRIALRLAEAAARTGKPDEALALIDRVERAARLPNAQFLADLALRRGTIALRSGDRAAAARQFDRAAGLFPGWWPAEAHRAQIDALEGRTARAIAAFTRIARSVSSPEAMDALASLYRARGDPRAQRWADRAGSIWAGRYRLFPEAAAGHAAEHALAFGDPKRALAYARADVAARPYGQPRTTLAWALIANGDPRGALAALAPIFASGWVSAESRLAQSQALLLLGRSGEAESARDAALAIDPHAGDAGAALSWFAH
jgi:tetratricopeptide (TPR) repeat protein